MVMNLHSRRQFIKGISSLPFIATAPSLVFAQSTFKPVATQYIATLAGPDAKSGTGAETWGHWELDPGPRGVRLKNYEQLVANGGVAPAGWKYEASDWWLDENGLLMEPPVFGMKPGRYLVTGGRSARAILAVSAADAKGAQNWELSDNATIYDVTHLRCRAARYKPRENAACLPTTVLQSEFPIGQAAPMPMVGGCDKEDYAVLLIFGIEA